MRMNPHSRHLIGRGVVFALAIMFPYCEVLARGQLGGRLDWTYQYLENGDNQELFAQRYQATFRDHFFETHSFTGQLFLGNYSNLSNHLTTRRYRGELILKHQFYTLDARVVPRQKTTPLELERFRERSENRLFLDIHVPRAPRLRLSYGSRDRYSDGEFNGRTQDLRGDLSYERKYIGLRLNRLNQRSSNGGVRTTNVTGGSIRLRKSYIGLTNTMSASGGYEHQLTQTGRDVGLRRDVTSQTLTGLLRGSYRKWANGTLSMQTRYLTTSELTKHRTRNDNFMLLARLFPASRAKVDLSRTYLSTEREDSRTQADYFTAQLLVDQVIRRGTTGRLQLTLREDINTQGGVLPADIFFLSIRSRLYYGTDLRAEVNVSKRNDDSTIMETYHTLTLFDLFLKPRSNLNVNPSLILNKFTDNISFRNNDRRTFLLNVTYFVRRTLNVGLLLNHEQITRGTKQDNTSLTFNTGARLRNRASLNAALGFNKLDFEDDQVINGSVLDSRSTTFNLQAQFWLTRRGSLNMNFTNIRRKDSNDSKNVAINFRQDF